MKRDGIRAKLTLRTIAFGLILILGLGFVVDGLWIKGKAVVAQILLDRAFIASVHGSPKPWAWADIEPLAKITAPRLGKSNIVLNNTSGEALAFGPGHLSGTPLPGEPGTSVFSAHRDTHFSWLNDLRKGDAVNVERRDGRIIQYEIRRAWVAEAGAPGINADSDENLIALTTCWPLDGTKRSKWRYIVEGVEVKKQSGEANSI